MPVDALLAADLDQCRIRALIGDVTVYRAPSPKTGAGLARMSTRQREQNLFRVK